MSDAQTAAPASAVDTLRTFLEAAQRKDAAGMKALLTRATLESGNFRADEGPTGMRYELDAGQMEGAVAAIPARLYAEDQTGGEPAMAITFLLVQEDGGWKVDLGATVERMLGGAMEQMGEALAEGAQVMGEAIGDALTQAFGGDAAEEEAAGEDDPAWDEATLTPGAEELHPLPAMVELPQTQAALSEAAGSPVLALVAADDLLRQLGSDQRAQLLGWLDGELMCHWGHRLADAVQEVPVRGRLRAVRLEAARTTDRRLLVLDGSDLVYRMYLGHSDGYYGDAEIADMLPALLAGLPDEIGTAWAGQRLLPTDDEPTTVAEYRERHVPRWMRRIRELVGKPVRLDADWRAAADANNNGPDLPRWGLNRVYGALAWVCLDEDDGAQLRETLRTVRLALGARSSAAEASYDAEEGVLEVGLSFYGGEHAGCYEYEIGSAVRDGLMDSADE